MVISWHGVNEKFRSVADMKLKLFETLSEHLPPATEMSTFEVGYLEGRRQIKRWIVADDDVTDMYDNAPSDDNEILLWCDGKDVSHKRKCVSDSNTEAPAPKRSSTTHEDAVESLTQELEVLHGEKYNYSQFKLWARMIVNKQHRDKNTPPNIPMIMGKPEKKEKKDLSDCLSDCAVAIVKALKGPPIPTVTETLPVCSSASSGSNQGLSDGISPGKKVNLRSQYLAQLRTLQTLRDDGVLTADEFQDEKASILRTLKGMK